MTLAGLRDRVPCVFGRWLSCKSPRWWPVLPSPLHNDIEHLRFPAWHFHVDGRYLTDAQNAMALKFNGRHSAKFPNHPMYTYPLVTFVRPQTWEACTAGANADMVEVTAFLRHCRRTRLLLQRRQMPQTPNYSTSRTFLNLFAAHPDPVAVDGRCPHKGADLAGLPCNNDGTVTCPLHGLRVRVVESTI